MGEIGTDHKDIDKMFHPLAYVKMIEVPLMNSICGPHRYRKQVFFVRQILQIL